jgi:hypothetical protein
LGGSAMVVKNIVSDVLSVENNSTINYVISGQVALQRMKNPDVLATKGSPKNITKSRRMVPIGEQKRTKKKKTDNM